MTLPQGLGFKAYTLSMAVLFHVNDNLQYLTPGHAQKPKTMVSCASKLTLTTRTAPPELVLSLDLVRP